MADFGTKTEYIQDEVRVFAMTASKTLLKTSGMSQGHRSQFERAPLTESGTLGTVIKYHNDLQNILKIGIHESYQ